MDQISPDALFFEPPMFVQTDTIVINPSPNLVTICNKNNLQPAPSIWQQFGACPVAPSSDVPCCLEARFSGASEKNTVHPSIKI
jgi:hypothetical protein